MDTVFDLWFIREYEDREDTQLHIGIYASEADAMAAVESLKDKPGFRDYPEGFEANATKLGMTGWQHGFITKVGSPRKDANGEAFDLPAFIDDCERGETNDR